jgi:hypothetical protein
LSCVYIVCFIVVSVLFVCCLIVVPLPPGENPFAVNNNNNVSGVHSLQVQMKTAGREWLNLAFSYKLPVTVASRSEA